MDFSGDIYKITFKFALLEHAQKDYGLHKWISLEKKLFEVIKFVGKVIAANAFISDLQAQNFSAK